MFHVHDANGPLLSFEAESVRDAIDALEEIDIPAGDDLVLLSEEVRQKLKARWDALPPEKRSRTFCVHWSDCCVAHRVGSCWQRIQ